MTIAVIKEGICTELAYFIDYESAQIAFDEGTWPNADMIVELPDGYYVGDSYDGETWTMAERPVVPPPEPEPAPPDIAELTESINILLGGRDDELDDIIGSGA